jgi:hypothetical protein
MLNLMRFDKSRISDFLSIDIHKCPKGQIFHSVA